jgi:hypothetical protein
VEKSTDAKSPVERVDRRGDQGHVERMASCFGSVVADCELVSGYACDDEQVLGMLFTRDERDNY